jgi:hypothetical protein
VEDITIEKLPIINLALFGFLTISLGIEVSVPVTLLTSGFYGVLLTIAPPLIVRRACQAKKPDVPGVATAAQALCSANS